MAACRGAFPWCPPWWRRGRGRRRGRVLPQHQVKATAAEVPADADRQADTFGEPEAGGLVGDGVVHLVEHRAGADPCCLATDVDHPLPPPLDPRRRPEREGARERQMLFPARYAYARI
uniref:Uncharacterized protein n=1 Tax=Oryza rufipogon TaxID=4529 RepID=A0A0E0MWL1_ORYRU